MRGKIVFSLNLMRDGCTKTKYQITATMDTAVAVIIIHISRMDTLSMLKALRVMIFHPAAPVFVGTNEYINK